MSNIENEGGRNDCYWNVEGKCTNLCMPGVPSIKGGQFYRWSRSWESNVNCVYTQIGVVKCGEYKQEGLVK